MCFHLCVCLQVLKISLIGHRKRILASLGDRLHEDTPQKPPRAISLRVRESLLYEKSLQYLNMCIHSFPIKHLICIHQTEKKHLFLS